MLCDPKIPHKCAFCWEQIEGMKKQMQRRSRQLKTRLAQLLSWLEHCTGIAAEFFIGFFRQCIIDYEA